MVFEKEVDEVVERTKPGYLEAVYHLYSMALKQGPFVLRQRTTNRRDNTHLASLTPIYRGAEFQGGRLSILWHFFDGHPDLRRILMWDGFKDFPNAQGFTNPPMITNTSRRPMTRCSKSPTPLSTGGKAMSNAVLPPPVSEPEIPSTFLKGRARPNYTVTPKSVSNAPSTEMFWKVSMGPQNPSRMESFAWMWCWMAKRLSSSSRFLVTCIGIMNRLPRRLPTWDDALY